MPDTMFEFSVPLVRRGFGVLSSYLAVAKEYVQLQGLAESDILNARLAPDMLPFVGQIHGGFVRGAAGSRYKNAQVPGVRQAGQLRRRGPEDR